MSKPLGKPDRIVVALGGNALGNNPVEQIEAVSNTAHALLGLIEQGNEIIITHGNGPQVGMIQNAFAAYHKQQAKSDIMPLSMCVAMSQGYIGYDLQVRSMLLTVSGLLVVLIGLRMWGVPFLRRISPELTKPCRFLCKAFAVGLLTGLMPCGALSSMWIFAASSGSWASGAVSMLAFGAGTCVFMLLFGLLGTFLPKRYNKYLLKGSTILIVALGLSLMTKGIRLLI